jgi:hypothetical protein
LFDVTTSAEGRRSNAGLVEEWPSELGVDVAGGLEGNGDVNERDIECLLRDPEGDVLRLREFADGRDTPSSVMMNSASVTKALSRLPAGTTVLVDCSDSAMETGRGVRVPPDAPDRGRTV